MFIYSSSLRLAALFLKCAAAINLESFEKIIHELIKINGDPKNYKDDSLTFSPQGSVEIKALPTVGNLLGNRKDMMSVIKTLSSLVDTAAATGDEVLTRLSRYLGKSGTWETIDVKGKEMKDAQALVHNRALEVAAEAIDTIKGEMKKEDGEREKKLDIIRDKLNKGEVTHEEAVKLIQDADKKLVYKPKDTKPLAPESELKTKILNFGGRVNELRKHLQEDKIKEEEAFKQLEEIVNSFKQTFEKVRLSSF